MPTHAREQHVDIMSLFRFAETVSASGVNIAEQLAQQVERITHGEARLQLDQFCLCHYTHDSASTARRVPVAFSGRVYGTLLVQSAPGESSQPQIPDATSQQLAIFCGTILHLLETDALLRALGRDLPSTPPDALTPRQQEVLELIAHGLDDDAIMEKLCISDKTLRRHDLYARLCVHCEVDMLLVAHSNGLISYVER